MFNWVKKNWVSVLSVTILVVALLILLPMVDWKGVKETAVNVKETVISSESSESSEKQEEEKKQEEEEQEKEKRKKELWQDMNLEMSRNKEIYERLDKLTATIASLNLAVLVASKDRTVSNPAVATFAREPVIPTGSMVTPAIEQMTAPAIEQMTAPSTGSMVTSQRASSDYGAFSFEELPPIVRDAPNQGSEEEELVHKSRLLNLPTEVRGQAVASLSNYPNERVVRYLLRTVLPRDPSIQVRIEAVRTLGKIAPNEAIPNLQRRLADAKERPEVKDEIQKAISQIRMRGGQPAGFSSWQPSGSSHMYSEGSGLSSRSVQSVMETRHRSSMPSSVSMSSLPYPIGPANRVYPSTMQPLHSARPVGPANRVYPSTTQPLRPPTSGYCIPGRGCCP
ncbi:MAG: HEAT repeat domain-containing protein [Candidatus Nealsonbacteria bacterium]